MCKKIKSAENGNVEKKREPRVNHGKTDHVFMSRYEIKSIILKTVLVQT